MADTKILDFLFDGDSEARAEEMWAALRARSEQEANVEASGEYDDHWLLSTFHWRSLRESSMQSFEGNDGPERWTVPDVPHVEVRYESAPFEATFEAESNRGPEDVTKDLIDLVTFLYSATEEKPRFAYGVTGLHQEHLAGNEMPLPVTAESLSENRIEYATWLMLFPPAMVETYGRTTVLSAPVWETEELDDGAIIVVASSKPFVDADMGRIDEHFDLERPPEADEFVY